MKTVEKRYWDILSLVLLFGVLSISSYRLEITNWAESLYLIGYLVLAGYALGVLLGKSKINSWIGLIIGLIVGVILLPWMLGKLLGSYPDYFERIIILIHRLQIAFSDFLDNRPVSDTILFIFMMAILYWTVCFLAGYELIRRANPWIPVVISSFIYLVINHYDSSQDFRNFYTFLLIFFILILWGRLFFIRKRELWKQKGIKVEYETGYGHIRTTLVAAIILVLTVWNIPFIIHFFSTDSPVQEYMIREWEDVRERFSNVFVGLNYPDLTSSDYYRSGLSLGSSAVTSSQPVFKVKVKSGGIDKVRYYWHGYSYDTYYDGRWVNLNDTKAMAAPSDWPIETPEWKSRKKVEFEFTVDSPLLFTFYSPDPMIYIDQPSEIVIDNRFLENINLIAVLANPALHREEKYRTVSLIGTPTERELRTSGENYPKDILDRYLQLPENFSGRIINLASEITKEEKNAYDKTIKITNYLRSNIEYSDTLPPKPAGSDVLEWVLFDHKEGFCNYYASLEVLMLRSIGIPARLAVGYSEGTEQKGGDGYNVLKNNSHAWPEVFFPGFGWIEFEPTAAQPPLNYPSGETTPEDNPFANLNSSDFSSGKIGMGRLGPEEEEIFLLDEVPSKPINPVQMFFMAATLIALLSLGTYVYKRIQKSPSHLFVLIRKPLIYFGLHVPVWMDYLAVMTQINSRRAILS